MRDCQLRDPVLPAQLGQARAKRLDLVQTHRAASLAVPAEAYAADTQPTGHEWHRHADRLERILTCLRMSRTRDQ